MSKVLSIVDVHNSDFLVILLSFSVLSLVSFTFLWFYNRRKFQSLDHDLPADVVKTYIDAIIQNSHVLKTSLFRGETGDAVMPVVGGGETVREVIKEVPVSDSELQGKLDSIQSMLAKSEKRVEELESQINGGDSKLKSSQNKVAELEAQVQELKSNSGSSEVSPELQTKLDEVSKEKDMLRERLQEYEIIEDDLANLKRLQQENEQLKKSLAEAQGGAAPEAAAPSPEPVAEAAPAPEPTPEPVAEPVAEAAPVEEVVPDNVTELAAAVAPEEEAPKAETTEMAAAEEDDVIPPEVEEKAPSNDPDDLLREFEKMLG